MEEGRLSFVHGRLFYQGIMYKESIHPLTKPWILRHSLEKSIILPDGCYQAHRQGGRGSTAQPMQIRYTMQKSIKPH